MSPALAMSLIATLGVLLAAASATAGALWWRSRSWPMVRAASLARELAERQRALEALIERIEARLAEPTPAPPPVPRGPARRQRADLPASRRAPLIAVPDLSSNSQRTSARLDERYGEVWDLAEAGNAPEEIARRLGQPVGQVELILGLRRQIATGPRA